MFDERYEVQKVNVTTSFSVSLYLRVTHYRFKSRSGERYMIDVTEYPHRFFTIDFYRRQSRNSRNKFTELTGERDTSRILGTVIGLMAELLVGGKEEKHSFGFIGTRMPDEPAESVSKRFRVYRTIVQFLISPIDFEHLYEENCDAYVILNRNADRNAVLDIARQVFDKEEEE